MADFCKQCSIELFGCDTEDFKSLGHLKDGEGWSVICEGCGFSLVDENGVCIMCDLKPDEIGHGPARFIKEKNDNPKKLQDSEAAE